MFSLCCDQRKKFTLYQVHHDPNFSVVIIMVWIDASYSEDFVRGVVKNNKSFNGFNGLIIVNS